MPAYHVEKSISINAPEDKVRSAIEDFKEWPKWSPWLCMERDAKLTYLGEAGQVGHGYDWEGELVGVGNMRMASVGQNYGMDLTFIKPFKSKADVRMEVSSAQDSAVTVTWHLDGKMPFFLFFMVDMMKSMIGMDYMRGLKMLKEYVETGAVISESEIVGIVDFPETKFLGVEGQGQMSELGELMKQTLPRAHQLATEHDLGISGAPGTLYHDINFKTQHCQYTSILPVENTKDIAGAVCGSIGNCKAVKVVHRGSYENLGNGWSTAMSYQRYKKKKALKNQPTFEFYPNDPAETPEKDLITEIYVPVKG